MRLIEFLDVEFRDMEGRLYLFVEVLYLEMKKKGSKIVCYLKVIFVDF